MSETKHPWCRDVSRDEAIRLAEDAAAAERTPLPDHRDLPSVVAELRERVARLTTKHNALVDLARLDAGWVKTQEDCLAAERDAALRERDAAKEEAEKATTLAKGLEEKRAYFRKSRDDARAECERRLTMCESMKRERDAAQFNVSCLKDRVAELEAAAAPAANAGGEQQEPVAWGVFGRGIIRATSTSRSDAVDMQSEHACDTSVVPLYAAPQPPRGWLTREEREAVYHAADIIEDMEDDDGSSLKRKADVLRSITDRSTPPRVKVPNLLQQNTWQSRDSQWIAAIREAGGEVE